jgi:hypothetical protein
MRNKDRTERRKKQKKEQEEQKTLACETRCADTMVAVYSVVACGVVSARLRKALIDV